MKWKFAVIVMAAVFLSSCAATKSTSQAGIAAFVEEEPAPLAKDNTTEAPTAVDEPAKTFSPEGHTVSLNKLLAETQMQSEKMDKLTLISWMPEELLRLMFMQNRSSVPEAEIEKMLNIFLPYTLIMVVDGKMGPFGGATFMPENIIRSNILLMDSRGTQYPPFNEDQIGQDMKNFLSIMKPIFRNMYGQMGQGMHFFCFPSKDEHGQRLADATKEGSFSVGLGGELFRWKLPLSSLLPPKTCPTCGENLSGAYKYCPWDGTQLAER